ncbi:MAG: hypothetical protein MJZ16_13795 [Bacteroidales bacterium]|nr:hypothetical protein [Bacteroidales bacterium]
MNTALFDKRSVFQVLGGLMKCPEYIDEYGVVDTDFEVEAFYRLIYSAIHNLYHQNVKVIDSFAIDSLLSHYDTQYQIFESNKGVEYCMQAMEICEIDNFTYYLEKVKKFSFLRYLESEGYDVRKIYDYTITDPIQQEAEMEKLDTMSIPEMINLIEGALVINSKLKFCLTSQNKGQLAGVGLMEVKERLKEEPEFGPPLQSPFLTTAARGARLKKIYVRSSSTAGGKTRTALADFCKISIPWYYDLDQKKWIHTGYSEPALVISTELEVDEVQTIVLAYVSGVPEDHILSGEYKGNEEERVDQAIQYISSSALYIETLFNFSIQDVETVIKKYHRIEGVNYVCFDYIHMSTRLISEISGETHGMKNLREDQILFLFIDKLKTLCNTLGIFILTMTQLNGTYKDSPIKDETMLRGAKSLADRIDLGEISLPPTQGDLKAVKPIIAKLVNKPEPNLVRHIYKLRRGKLSKIRIWQYADLGTCRTTDLFVTNYDYKLIPVEATQIDMVEEAIKNESVNSEEITMTNEEATEAAKTLFDW